MEYLDYAFSTAVKNGRRHLLQTFLSAVLARMPQSCLQKPIRCLFVTKVLDLLPYMAASICADAVQQWVITLSVCIAAAAAAAIVAALV